MKIMIPHICLLLFTSSLLGCGATSYPDLVKRRADVKTLKRQKNSLKKRLKRFKGLKDLGQNQQRLVLSGSAVKHLLAQFHPHSAKGEKLSKKHLRGTFSLSKPQRIQFLGLDKMRYQVRFAGKNVSVNLKGVPFAGAKQERELKSALTAGAKVVVETRMRIDKKRGAIWFDSDCVSLELKQQNTRRNRDYLKEALNKKIFNIPKVVQLPKAFASKGAYVFVAKDGIVLGVAD